MKNECFSCQKTAPQSIQERLALHKRIFEQTGEVFYFFRENTNGQTKITDAKSFNTILEQIKNNEGAEWCHIAEFGQSTNDNVSKHTKDKKPEIIKRKRNTGTTK